MGSEIGLGGARPWLQVFLLASACTYMGCVEDGAGVNLAGGPAPSALTLVSSLSTPSLVLSPMVSSPGQTLGLSFRVGNLPALEVTVELLRGGVAASCSDSEALRVVGMALAQASDSSKVLAMSPAFVDSGNDDGAYRFFARLKDLQGSLSACSASISYVLDTLAPVIISAAGGDSLSDDGVPRRSKAWQWSCKDAATCQYRHAITTQSTHRFGASVSFGAVKTATQPSGNGRYYLHVQSKDSVGNQSEVASYPAILDNTPPDIAFHSHSNQDRVRAKKLVIKGGCETSGGSVSLSGAGLVSMVTQIACIGGSFSALVTLGSGDGEKSISVLQQDAAGNEGTSTLALVLESSLSTPSLALGSGFSSPGRSLAPAFIVSNLPDLQLRAQLYRGDATATCSDMSQLSLVGLKQAAAADSTVTLTTNPRFAQKGAEDGQHKFFARLVDQFGNRSACSASVNYILDTKAPVLLADGGGALVDDTTPRQSKTWQWDCEDASTCQYRSTITSGALHSFGQSVVYGSDLSAQQTSGDGTYYLHVQVRDAVGNESEVFSYSAILDHTAPVITSVEVDDGLYVGGHHLELMVIFSELVVVTGTPRIALTVGGSSQWANYHRGSSSNTLAFRYVVGASDSDADGIVLPALAIALNGGTIKDRASHNAISLNFISPGNLANATVNGAGSGIVLSKTVLEVGENAGSTNYTVRLSVAPASDVVVSLASSDASKIVVAPGGLTFTTRDWDVPQIVTVTGVDNGVDGTGNAGERVEHTVTGTGTYSGVDSSFVEVAVVDDDVIGAIDLRTSVSSLLESVGNASLTVTAEFVGSIRRNTTTSITVAVEGESAASSDFSVTNSFTITIPAGAGEASHVVSLSVTDDAVDEDNEVLVFSGSAAGGVVVNDARVTIVDNDTRGVSVSSPSLLVYERSSVRYTVRLDSKPTDSITVVIVVADAEMVTTSVEQLAFDSLNWQQGQAVEVTGILGASGQSGSQQVTVKHLVYGGGYVPGAEMASMEVTVQPFPLAITSAPIIWIGNQGSYQLQGSCGGGGATISAVIGGISFSGANSTTCSNERWTLSGLDVSSLSVNQLVSIEVEQSVVGGNSLQTMDWTNRCVGGGYGDSAGTHARWICDYQGLKDMASAPNKHYALAMDVDALASWSEGESGCAPFNGTVVAGVSNPCRGWVPVTGFTGSLDGRGHSIGNLYVYSKLSSVGFLGFKRGAVKGLHLRRVYIEATDDSARVGGLVGWDQQGGVRESSVVGVVKGGLFLGGLVGYAQDSLYNNYVDVEMMTSVVNADIGGLVGHVESLVNIVSCYARGEVEVIGSTSIGSVGGLVGYHYQAAIHSVYARVAVSGINRAGGLVGLSLGDGSISHAYAVGRVSKNGGSGDPLLGELITLINPVLFGQLFWDSEFSGLSSSLVATAVGLMTGGMQVASSSNGTGIYSLGDGFSFALGSYPKLKKCSYDSAGHCDVSNPAFASDLVGGQ